MPTQPDSSTSTVNNSKQIATLEKKKQHLDRFSRLMDESITIPIVNVKMGLDALIGFVPIVGDLAGAAISTYFIYHGVKTDIPKDKVARMAFNVGIESLLGMVPVLGDLFDVTWRANRQNYRIIAEHIDQSINELQPREPEKPGEWENENNVDRTNVVLGIIATIGLIFFIASIPQLVG